MQRDLALFNLAIDSKLRGCDLVALRDSDIVTGDSVAVRSNLKSLTYINQHQAK